MKKILKFGIPIIFMILSIIGIVVIINNAKNNMQESNILLEPPNRKETEINENRMDPKEEPPTNLDKKDELESPLKKVNTLDKYHKMGIFFLTAIFSFSLLFIIMSLSNEKFYLIKDKIIIYVLLNIIFVALFSYLILFFTNQFVLIGKEQNSSKEEVELNKNNIIDTQNINLNDYKEDITINKEGTYMVEGNFNHSLIIDANKAEVKLVLNNVTIKSNNTAAIIGLSANKITIELKEGSQNILSDSGNSKYDGCIFSNVELVFEGEGELSINGNQKEGEGITTENQSITFNGGIYNIISEDDGINAGGDNGGTITINDGTFYINASGDGIDSNKNAIINGGTIFVIGSDIGGDAGIDTDKGFEVNGGTIVALGSDMIETPLKISKQKFIAFTLKQPINKNTIVSLLKDEKEIISFEAPKNFKTIIISSDKLEEGTYELFSNGEHSETLINGIYQKGIYNKGEKIATKTI